MWNRNYLIILTLLGTAFIVHAQDDSREAYINKYKDIAINEMERTGIPASIKLAQGILESNGGKSTLARKANNHFGIKCHNDWRGKKYYLEDDDYDESGQLTKSCFRVYKNGEASYIAHSEFLRDPNKRYRYGFLFNLDPKDYKGWANGLKKAGYATSPTYARGLINVIESYELYKYDDAKRNEESEEYAEGILRNNDVKYVLASGTESPADIAQRTDTKLKCINIYNEKIGDPYQKLPANTRIYIQKKRKNYRGKKKWHYVQKGETMYKLSQEYGLRLEKLLKRNRLEPGEQPAKDEKIKLRGWKIRNSDKPILSSEVYNDAPVIERDDDIFFEGEEDFGNDIEMEIDDIIEDDEDFDEPIIINEPVVNPPVKTDPEITAPAQPTAIYHVVQPKETLYAISRMYNTTVDSIKLLNGLNSNIISIGLRLRVK